MSQERFILTLQEFGEMNDVGRFFSFFFHGKSCVNCDWLIKGECTNEEHITRIRPTLALGKNHRIELKMAFYGKSDDIFHVGNACEDWKLIQPWNKKRP